MIVGPLYSLVKECDKKIIVLQGGTSSGKTVTALQVCGTWAIEDPGSVTTVIGMDVPALKKGAMRDFERHVYNDPDFRPYFKAAINKTEKVYEFRNGSIVEFSSFASSGDAATSGKRQYAFFNEIDNIPYDIFWHIVRRTYKTVIVDFNPRTKFYVHAKILNAPATDKEYYGKSQLFITDHRHNPFLSKQDHEDIENIADPELHRVYARGLTGKVEGVIYRMKPIGALPTLKVKDAEGKEVEQPLPFGFGIDFGYNSDKTAIVKIYFDKRDRYWQVLLYKPENDIMTEIIEKGLQLTPAGYMAKILKDNGCTTSTLVWGDHDKNMSAQLRRLGIPFRMARKGPNSLITGISKVKEFNNYYYQSPELEKELETYIWEKAVDQLTGNEITTTTPIDGMPDDALAAGRYFIYSHSMRYATE